MNKSNYESGSVLEGGNGKLYMVLDNIEYKSNFYCLAIAYEDKIIKDNKIKVDFHNAVMLTIDDDENAYAVVDKEIVGEVYPLIMDKFTHKNPNNI